MIQPFRSMLRGGPFGRPTLVMGWEGGGWEMGEVSY